MSFVLPGNQRQLRFTGEAKAFTPKDDPSGANGNVALGKPRVRRNTAPPVPPPSAPPSIHPTQPSARAHRTTAPPPSPLTGGRMTPVPSPSFRERDFDDVEDQQATMAIDREREGIDLMPGPVPRPSSRPSGAPIPHFRPANAAVATVLVPGQEPEAKKGAPLALWLFAAVLAGVLSYFVTPMAMSHFESPPPRVVAVER